MHTSSQQIRGRFSLALLYLLFVVFILGISFTGCMIHRAHRPADSPLLVKLLAHRNPVLEEIMGHPDKYRLQILYTQIDRDSENQPRFKSHAFHLTPDRYFYPASSVKLPAAVLALEKINVLNIDGLTRDTPFRIDSACCRQTPLQSDSTAPDGLPTIAHFIRKIFLVSDNDAFNRLYEFLGQQYLNETLWQKGYQDVKIIRRLERDLTPEENRATNPFTFFLGNRIVYQQPLVVNPHHYRVDMPDVRQGKGHYRRGEFIPEPIDFSYSNYISVENLQAILRAVIFPNAVPPRSRFQLTEDDYRFLYRYMSMYPRESGIPAYQDTSEYYDSYVKFFLFGDSRKPIPTHIRLFSKSGMAYGYLIDNAYIVDFRHRVEFFLTAVVQVNANQIYNDDQYEYDELGVPFMAELGRAIYEYELQRSRTVAPHLSRFQIHYRKDGL